MTDNSIHFSACFIIVALRVGVLNKARYLFRPCVIGLYGRWVGLHTFREFSPTEHA